MKLGFILECGPEGADAKVCRHLIKMINETHDKSLKMIEPVTLGDKPTLIQNCGNAAKQLIETDKCDRVIILFDVDSKKSWNKNRDLKTDREDIFKALDTNEVNREKVFLVGIIRELESWLISDGRALENFFRKLTKRSPGRISAAKNPEHEADPKAWLNRLFREHGGRTRKYRDWKHAELIAQQFPSFREVGKCSTFQRFLLKVADIET